MEAHEQTVIPGAGGNSLISREWVAAPCPFGERAERRRESSSIPSPARGSGMALGEKLVHAQSANGGPFGAGAIAVAGLSPGAARRLVPQRLQRAEEPVL